MKRETRGIIYSWFVKLTGDREIGSCTMKFCWYYRDREANIFQRDFNLLASRNKIYKVYIGDLDYSLFSLRLASCFVGNVNITETRSVKGSFPPRRKLRSCCKRAPRQIIHALCTQPVLFGPDAIFMKFVGTIASRRRKNSNFTAEFDHRRSNIYNQLEIFDSASNGSCLGIAVRLIA